jgi:hypothetical protein
MIRIGGIAGAPPPPTLTANTNRSAVFVWLGTVIAADALVNTELSRYVSEYS